MSISWGLAGWARARWRSLLPWIAVLGLVVLGCRLLATWRVHPPVSAVDAMRADQWMSKGSEVELRLATWNVWGVPLGTLHRKERMEKLARTLADSRADVICLQEIFLEEDRRTICAVLAASGLRHYRYFSSAPGGSGLLTVSRHPIVEAAFHRFSVAGNPLAFSQADWWAGKGAGVVTIEAPGFGRVRVINTHLQARYKGEEYIAVRQSQLGELAGLAQAMSSGGGPVLVMGDLNFRRDDEFAREVFQTNNWQELSEVHSPIDYILAVANERMSFLGNRSERLHGILDDGKTPLSDHRGIVADVRIVLKGASGQN